MPERKARPWRSCPPDLKNQVSHRARASQKALLLGVARRDAGIGSRRATRPLHPHSTAPGNASQRGRRPLAAAAARPCALRPGEPPAPILRSDRADTGCSSAASSRPRRRRRSASGAAIRPTSARRSNASQAAKSACSTSGRHLAQPPRAQPQQVRVRPLAVHPLDQQVDGPVEVARTMPARICGATRSRAPVLTSTRPASRPGWRSANSSAIAPPIEWPASTNRGSPSVIRPRRNGFRVGRDIDQRRAAASCRAPAGRARTPAGPAAAAGRSASASGPRPRRARAPAAARSSVRASRVLLVVMRLGALAHARFAGRRLAWPRLPRAAAFSSSYVSSSVCGNDPGLCEQRHEVRVARPARHHVHVHVVLHPRARDLADVRADVEALRDSTPAAAPPAPASPAPSSRPSLRP